MQREMFEWSLILQVVSSLVECLHRVMSLSLCATQFTEKGKITSGDQGYIQQPHSCFVVVVVAVVSSSSFPVS